MGIPRRSQTSKIAETSPVMTLSSQCSRWRISLRLSEDVQRRCEEVEHSGYNTDWIEVASEVQKEVLREFIVSSCRVT